MLCTCGYGGWILEYLTNFDPFISKVGVRWLKAVIGCIDRVIKVTKMLNISSGGPEYVFNSSAAPHVDESG